MNAGRSQIKWIHVLKSRLKLSEENYRALLAGYGVSSSKDLPMRRAFDLVRRLENEAVRAGVWQPRLVDKGRFSSYQGRPGMASPAQLRHIEGVWSYVSRQPTAELKKEALHKWLTNRFRVSRLEWVTESMVPRILTALDAMVKQKEKADGNDKADDGNTGNTGHDSAGEARTQPGGDRACVQR